MKSSYYDDLPTKEEIERAVGRGWIKFPNPKLTEREHRRQRAEWIRLHRAKRKVQK